MAMFRDRKAGRIQDKKTDNYFFKIVEEFKYLRKSLTNQILFRKKL